MVDLRSADPYKVRHHVEKLSDSKYVEGRTPSGASETFYVSGAVLRELEESGRQAQLDALYSAAEVVKEPEQIYQGLKRPACDGAFCYVGRPQLYLGDSVEPAPVGYVFLVFIVD